LTQDFVGPNTVPVAVIFYLDEKRVAIKNGKKVYPVYISLGNHSYAARQRKPAKRLLAYLPVVETPQKREAALQLHQQCLALMLAPINKAVHTWKESVFVVVFNLENQNNFFFFFFLSN